MILRFSPQVLKNCLLPEAFHQVPVFDHSMSDRVIKIVCLAIGNRLVTNEEVEVINSPFGGDI